MISDSRTVLVTGATAGIGRFLALYLADRGHRVIATGRRADALTSLQQQAGGKWLRTRVLDVTDQSAIEATRTWIEEITDGGGLDALVNNAGFGITGPTELLPDEDVRAQFETNVFGLLAVTRAFAPSMRARGRGRIINVSSVGGRVTFPFFGVYNATKYAVEALSDALRMELAPFGVQVVLIEPGVIHSEFADRSTAALSRFAQPGSPWAWTLERADEIRARTDRLAVSPRCVAEAIERALLARRPRARIVAPARTRLMLALKALLPTAWLDALVRRAMGLTSARRRAFEARAVLPVGAPPDRHRRLEA